MWCELMHDDNDDGNNWRLYLILITTQICFMSWILKNKIKQYESRTETKKKTATTTAFSEVSYQAIVEKRRVLSVKKTHNMLIKWTRIFINQNAYSSKSVHKMCP